MAEPVCLQIPLGARAHSQSAFLPPLPAASSWLMPSSRLRSASSMAISARTFSSVLMSRSNQAKTEVLREERFAINVAESSAWYWPTWVISSSLPSLPSLPSSSSSSSSPFPVSSLLLSSSSSISVSLPVMVLSIWSPSSASIAADRPFSAGVRWRATTRLSSEPPPRTKPRCRAASRRSRRSPSSPMRRRVVRRCRISSIPSAPVTSSHASFTQKWSFLLTLPPLSCRKATMLPNASIPCLKSTLPVA